ncbi:MAG: hypothetical protein Q4C61_06055 [Lachnospiraceae bacterium]|nr:hypothetical protein [Lachnospiraceae bacterium]
MNWYPDLYVGKKAEKKKEALIRKIESGKTPVNTYLLALPAGDDNQLEIIPAWNMKFWYNKKSCPMIVGLGCGKDEMISMVQQIVQETVDRTGNADIRKYLENSVSQYHKV